MSSGTGDSHLGRAAHSLSHHTVHLREEHSHKQGQSSGPGASNRMVSFSLGVQLHLQAVKASSH